MFLKIMAYDVKKKMTDCFQNILNNDFKVSQVSIYLFMHAFFKLSLILD